jgi:hypothetical protein
VHFGNDQIFVKIFLKNFFYKPLKIYVMLNLIISILLSLGLIFTPEQYNNSTKEQKHELQEKAGIVDDDIIAS